MSKVDKKNKITYKKTFYILISVIVGLTLIYQLRPFLTDEEFMWISVPAYSLIPGTLSIYAAVFAFKLSKTHHYQAKAFLFFAIGAGCWFIAEQIWATYDHVFDQDPFPSEADIFYLAAYPFYLAFLKILLTPVWKIISKKIIFLSIIISASLLFSAISYTIIDYQDDLSLEFAIALSYPILSSILLTLAIIGILYLFKKRANYAWLLLLFGFITYSIADTVFMFTVLEDVYYDGHPVDLLYLYGIILLTFSVIERIRSYEKDKDMTDLEFHSEQIRYETIHRFGIPLVVIIILISVLTATISTIIHNTLTDSSFLLVIGIVVLLGIFSGFIFLLNNSINKLVLLRTKELEQQQETLENLVEKKTHELIKSERLAVIGELSGRLAHDLRNPLSVMKMSIDLIKQHSTDAKISDSAITKRLELIDKSIERISHQVDDVLDFVRFSPLKIVNISLRAAVLQSLKKVHIPSDISVTVDENNVHVDCDLTKLDAMFINLIINAIQAMPQGGEINIKFEEKDSDAIIKFENTGPSIPEENLDKIFEPLFTTKERGTGLGLSSCKNIAEQHGGTISAQNNPTTFIIKIPKLAKQLTAQQK